MKFPSHTGLILSMVLSVLAAFGCFKGYERFENPVRSFYLKTYLKASTSPALLAKHPEPKRFWVLRSTAADRQPMTLRPPYFCPSFSQYVTPRTAPELLQRVQGCYVSLPPGQFLNWLQANIYGGEDVWAALSTPLYVWGGLSFPLILAGLIYDGKQRKKSIKGNQLRGPQFVSRWKFNRKVKGDGFAFRIENPRNLLEWLQGEAGKYLRMKKRHENNHLIAMADPGGGKTQLVMQILDQVEARGEAAIIYDPHREFISRYYNEERGDIVLNPFDDRCPSWSPSDELVRESFRISESIAMGQAESLFPGQPSDRNWFFTFCCRLIWSFCISRHTPDAHQMAELIQYSDPLIDIVSQGTELEQIMAKNAQQQRSGVVAHLAQTAYSLRQVPKKEPGRKHFVIQDWVQERKYWIFITNDQRTRGGLRPLQSLWIDSLILALLDMGERPDLPKVFVALDEVQTAQELPQLVPLLTEGRKSLRAMIAFQGRSQIRNLYRDLAEVIFSVPFTKFLMRTSEPEAGEWLAKTVGDVEVEHLRETRSTQTGGQGGHSYSVDKRIEKLLLASQFKELDDREGYLNYGNLIVKFKLAIMPKRERAAKFIRREDEPVISNPLPSLHEVRSREQKERAAKEKREQDAQIAQVLQSFIGLAIKNQPPSASDQAAPEEESIPALSFTGLTEEDEEAKADA
ncbi:MAG: type IV secretion system DNA-binding domain-containing protein [Bryobacteraceae bacterium]|jgi:hypothetical protein